MVTIIGILSYVIAATYVGSQYIAMYHVSGTKLLNTLLISQTI